MTAKLCVEKVRYEARHLFHQFLPLREKKLFASLDDGAEWWGQNFSPVNPVKRRMFVFVLRMLLDVFPFATVRVRWRRLYVLLWQIYLFLHALKALRVNDSDRWSRLHNSSRCRCCCYRRGGLYRRKTCGLCGRRHGSALMNFDNWRNYWENGGGERWEGRKRLKCQETEL